MEFKAQTRSHWLYFGRTLAAIVMVSIMVIAITPALGVAIATRVQARRLERAAEAARSYVDGLRAGSVIAPPISTTVIPDQLRLPVLEL
ncbi:MAG: hypothetical protein HC890_03860 [Chloroflexaceae bacterium]|nr:hypothetical protein [Chloroflexaceae bacterium]